MKAMLDTVLLLALPASGKSEVRRYLELMPPDERLRDFHMGPSVQLDDFPYVHLMRRVDDELVNLGAKRIFFKAPDKPFNDPRDWGTLIALVNEDYAALTMKGEEKRVSPAGHLLERLDAASESAGAPRRLGALEGSLRGSLEAALDKDARQLMDGLRKNRVDTLEGKTLVVEFARGGPDGSAMPLPEPFGYRYSLSQLSPSILEKAGILYIWVTPEESRRKNQARTDPNDPGSILHHGVPLEVMLKDYGCDDMDWLEKDAKKPGTVTVSSHGRTFHLPVARFDNRVDRTSFLREDPKKWKPDHVRAVHDGLKQALTRLQNVRATPAVKPAP